MQFDEFIGFLKHIVELSEIVQGVQNKAAVNGAVTAAPNVGQAIVNQYEGLAQADDRDTLLRLCGEKGIAVPPRTKTLTLAKMLTEHDAKISGAMTTETASNTGADVAGPISEDDPFGDGPAAPPPAPEVTAVMVREALTKVHTTKGLAVVMDILSKFGNGVTKIKELRVEDYVAVYNACK